MSDYKIISKTEDASKERVFYTIEIAPFRFVDVMCIRNTSENYEYLIQNEDASYVYYELEYNIVSISTARNGEWVDDTDDVYVTDGSLANELDRIYHYRKFATK